jgi:phosphoglycerate dehydrogenase-like enzyme
MPRVLVAPSVLYQAPGTYRNVLEAAGLEVVYPIAGQSLLERKNLTAQLQGIDAVLASVEAYDRGVIEESRLRVIARVGVGYDAVDVAAASDHGTLVTITPGTNEHSVAELTIALMTGVYRGFPYRYHEVRSGKWTKRALPRLSGKTLGLVGLGRIGRAVVPRAQGLGLKVIAHDPLADPEFAEQFQVRLCTFPELLAQADIVSLHMPATVETTNLINRQTLTQMKRGSVLINTSRGALVDEDALCESLKSGHLLGAGLDVFKTEPLPLSCPLLELDNVLVSPHMGGLDEESLEAMTALAARCVADLYQGRWPEGCVVNADLRSGWKW